MKEFMINVPYKKSFKISQRFKGTAHDGFDMVGLTDKNIYATIEGKVEHAGWENPANKTQGFGQYVRIKKDNSSDRYYFGHLSKLCVSIGQQVKQNQLIGVEGNTGHSTGSHLHYCVRENASKARCRDISIVCGIPNKEKSYENPQSQAKKNAWVKDNTGWWYKKSDGTYPKNQWLLLDSWYFFDNTGYALCDTSLYDNGKTYKFDKNCRCLNPDI